MTQTPTTLTLDLPWPPSINHYYRHGRGRVRISREGQAYRERVGAEVLIFHQKERFGSARLIVRIIARPPDKRKRDLDNLLKPLLDALEHAKVFDDDSQIDHLVITRGEQVHSGEVFVRINVTNE